MTPSSINSLIILLHGVGSCGADMAVLGEVWNATLPDVAFASPNAPDAFDFGPGYQWFSIQGVTDANRPARILAAREAFDRSLTALIQRHGFAERLHRVALVGFSQGSIMALDAVASGHWPVGAVVAFSGRLSSPEPLRPARKTPLLLIHGQDDAVIPAGETSSAAVRLQSLGCQVETHLLPTLGHGISDDGLQLAGKFLARHLGNIPSSYQEAETTGH